ncbi:MAG: UbiH/UbiF/VisC/COQ6 family ubiquinone biosynthesis hydroxylase [Rhodospirillales bacterium]|nr:UbiH/UbiF/VisC/COQ6 family ubiquinone biosynthesis hydroxylase [Rhodospirillales bacterium]
MFSAQRKKNPRRRQPVTEADVLIVGGGLVGGALAAALAAEGIAVAVVDRERPGQAGSANAGAAKYDAKYDGRVSAIALSSRRLLEGIGTWAALAPEATPIRHIRVAEAGTPYFLHYDSREVGGEPFGYMVENRVLRRELGRRIENRGGISLFAPARIETLARGSFGVEAALAGGRRVRAMLAVAADGAASRTRNDAGIGLARRNYGQSAIVCTVRHERPHGFIAHELFHPAGPFAILPTRGRAGESPRAKSWGRSAIVWSERKDLAPHFARLDEDAFGLELTRRAGDFLGRMRLDSPRWTYPLSVQFAHRMTAERLALAGDAAHAMHPVAGQGLNMGLRDAAALASVLAEAKGLGLDLGAPDVLERYGRWRRFDNGLMLAMTDSLVRLFSNDLAPLRTLRGLGLSAVNRVPPLRRLFARHAMGVVGDLPRLMRGSDASAPAGSP